MVETDVEMSAIMDHETKENAVLPALKRPLSDCSRDVGSATAFEVALLNDLNPASPVEHLFAACVLRCPADWGARNGS